LSKLNYSFEAISPAFFGSMMSLIFRKVA